MKRVTIAARCAYRALRGRPIAELVIPVGSVLHLNGPLVIPPEIVLRVPWAHDGAEPTLTVHQTIREPICPWCKGGKRHAGPHTDYRYCPASGCFLPGRHEGPCLTKSEWHAQVQLDLAKPHLRRVVDIVGLDRAKALLGAAV